MHKNAGDFGATFRVKMSQIYMSLFLVGCLILVQGVSKRLLKVQVSITSLFYGAGDLKFCTDILQNYTI